MDSSSQQDNLISAADRDGLYRTIFSRRDVRGQFKSDPVPDAVLSRILYAAHHAPSVGFMQPWNFIIVKSKKVRQQIHDLFSLAHQEATAMFPDEKRDLYNGLKLEGIMESPVNICVTCDRQRTGPVVIGRTHISTMDLYSSVCAIQNLWLAARSEGLGVGWVSILDEQKMKRILEIPDHIVPVGYLCLGSVTHFKQKPELESAGWLPRWPLEDLVYFDGWDKKLSVEDPPLLQKIQADQGPPASCVEK
jgi:5,6-dimethylbenzimidazole synthase